MNVCAKNRKALAWLAIGAADESQELELRAHVASCVGCRNYLKEIEQVAQNVRAAEAPDEMEPSPFLGRRVRHAAFEERRGSSFGWRMAIPTVALIALVLLTLLPRSRPVAPVPSPPATRPPEAPQEIAPTILNYQLAANQSIEKLDALLTEQGNRALPATPVYRAGTFAGNPPN